MLDAEKSLLVVVDVQGKLADVVHAPLDMFANIGRLIQSANQLNVPIFITEQLPDKLGPTRSEVTEHAADALVIEKSSFSCCGEPSFIDALKKSNRSQIVLCGIETHICVLQTAMELLEVGYEVYAVADAVSSRALFNMKNALERMRAHGVEITVMESVLFEWLRDTAHPDFRILRKLLSL